MHQNCLTLCLFGTFITPFGSDYISVLQQQRARSFRLHGTWNMHMQKLDAGRWQMAKREK